MKKLSFLLLSFCLLGFALPANAKDSVMENLTRFINTATKEAVRPTLVSPLDAHIKKLNISKTELSEIIFQTEAQRFSIHPKQLLFRDDIYQNVNDIDVSEQNGLITLRFDYNKFEVYCIKLNTADFNYELPVLLNEVAAGSWQYNMTVSVILQQNSKNKQLTSFYFLFPKPNK